MPNVAGRQIPTSITSINRSTRQATVRLVVNPDPLAPGPDKYSFVESTLGIGQTMKTRRMLQKGDPSKFFEFTFPPSQIAYEGMGVELAEIPRPLMMPLVDVRASRNYKAVFEFLVANHQDGLITSVQNQLAMLEWMANSAEPVYFENFDSFLTNGFWYIAEFSVKTSRVNTDGEIVAAQCSISLLEYQERDTKFAKFPKIKYTNVTRRGGGGGTGTGGSDGSAEEALNTAVDELGLTPPSTSLPGTVSAISAGDMPGKTVYRFIRTTAPSPNETYGSQWTKVGDNYVYYSNSPKLPTLIGARTARGFVAAVNETSVSRYLSALNPTQRAAYEKNLKFEKDKGIYVEPTTSLTDIFRNFGR